MVNRAGVTKQKGLLGLLGFFMFGALFAFLGLPLIGLPLPSAAKRDTVTSAVREKVQVLLDSLSLEEKCASLLFVAYGVSRQFTLEFASRYQKVPVGGVLLFAYNIPPSAGELMDLTDGIRGTAKGRGWAPFIAIDHEGGTVLRLRGITTELPDARDIGRSQAPIDGIRQLFRLTSRQLSLLGFSMNLAPVVEPLTLETRPFLSRRVFSPLPERAAELGGLFLEEMREAGVLGVAKHFPGSGDGDPHERLPQSSARPSDPADPQTLPFRTLWSKGILEALMVSHVRLPREGVLEPASLSKRVLRDILRDQWGFEGIILTDDFLMKSVTQTQDPIQAVIRSVAAGADLVMYLGPEYPAVRQALVQAVQDGRVPRERLNEAVERVLLCKARYGLAKGLGEGTGEGNREGASPSQQAERSKRLAEFQRLKREGDALLQEVLR